ncbi:MAG: RluA family pseudouridine synthase [Myxococcaceae bacterium]
MPRPAKEPRIDRFLAGAVPGISVERARALIAEGRVRIRGKVVKAARKLWGGEEIELELPEVRAASRVEGPALSILFEDERFVVIDKPSKLVVEPEPGQISVVELLASQRTGFSVAGEALPGVAHRIDKDTTGCLILAKTDEALSRLKEAFESKGVEKTYLAIVLGSPEQSARLEGPYGRDPENPRKYTTRVESARRATLSFKVLSRAGDLSLLEVRLETGRTHQIRVQLSEAGFPLIGDPVYGTRESREHELAAKIGRIALHAWKLKIPALGIDVEAKAPFELRVE